MMGGKQNMKKLIIKLINSRNNSLFKFISTFLTKLRNKIKMKFINTFLTKLRNKKLFQAVSFNTLRIILKIKSLFRLNNMKKLIQEKLLMILTQGKMRKTGLFVKNIARKFIKLGFVIASVFLLYDFIRCNFRFRSYL